MPRKPRFVVYSSSLGNYFFDEIRDLLALGLRESGYDARTSDEEGGFQPDADWHLVVAPHEFFDQGPGARLRHEPGRDRLIFFSAEQPGCRFFNLALQLYPKAREIWHLDRQTTSLIRERGFQCRHVPLGYSAGFRLYRPIRTLPSSDKTAILAGAKRAASDDLSRRPIDFFFAGALSRRRDLFFSRHASRLSRHRSFIHFADPNKPLRNEDTGGMNGNLMAGLEQRSKIVLNVHRDQSRFFEWHRIAMHGLGQKALVLSEPLSEEPLLKPNRDFVEATFDDMPAALDHYLLSARGRREAQEIADRGFQTFSRACRMDMLLKPAVDVLLSPAKISVAPTLNGESDAGDQVFVKRRKPDTTVQTGGSGGPPAPRVTVAISLYNYRRYIVECLRSVERQTLRRLDLIIVDDGSTDGSSDAAARWLRSRGRRFARWTLVKHDDNAGLAAARNNAFSSARTPYVFVLDADNLLLPECLERLSEALDRCDALFAYSYLQCFGEQEMIANVNPWDVGTLKAGPYIDAMAMIRRSAWKKVGGFHAQGIQGWEDHDFWLRLARKGDWGLQVPQVLCRYRVHLHSMFNSADLVGKERLKNYFHREHRAAFGESVQAIPARVGGPTVRPEEGRRRHYLATALSILKDVRRERLKEGVV